IIKICGIQEAGKRKRIPGWTSDEYRRILYFSKEVSLIGWIIKYVIDRVAIDHQSGNTTFAQGASNFLVCHFQRQLIVKIKFTDLIDIVRNIFCRRHRRKYQLS